MSKINVAGVLKGGLVAGLIMAVSQALFNAPVAGARMEAEFQALNLPLPGAGDVTLFMVTTLLLGVMTVLLYAAIRPRFGPGPATAVRAGLFIWLVSYVYANMFFGGLGVGSWGLIALTDVWAFFECLIAATAGAYFYSEP